MSIRELIALVSKELEPRPVSRPTTVRARPQLEALETRIRMAPSGTGTVDPSLPPPPTGT